MRTGFPQADARDDFERARRQARWGRTSRVVASPAMSRNRLLVLGEVTIVTGASRHGPASEAAVPIERIVGSVEPTLCFFRHFRPTSQLPRTRFERIAADVRCGRGIDSVDLYHCGDRYYVLDGHHRIAVARALGERWILATITEVRMNQSGAPRGTPGLTRQQREQQRGCTNLGRRHDTEQLRSRGSVCGCSLGCNSMQCGAVQERPFTGDGPA